MQKNLGFKGYGLRSASSFWLDRDFDVSFKDQNRVDYTKLAAAQRAIANFVNIVTGKQIPVEFQNNDSSYTDGSRVVIGTNLEDKNFDPAVGLALHEGSHIAFTDFSLFKGGSVNTSYLSNTNFAKYIRMQGLDPDLDMTESEFAIIKDLLNWIEDRRIDYKIYTNAPGYRMYYEAMYNKYFNDKIIDKALEIGEKRDENLDCYMFHIINFTNPKRNLDALKQLRDIWNIIDLKNINRLKSTTDALDVACQVYKVLKAAIKEQEENAANNASSQQDGDADVELVEGDASGNSQSEEGDSDTRGGDLTLREQEKLKKAIQSQKDFLQGTSKKVGRLSKTDAKIVEAIKESGTEVRDVATGPAGNESIVSAVVIKKLTPQIIESLSDLFVRGASDYVQGTRVLQENSWGGGKIIRMQRAVEQGILLGKKLGSKLQLRNADRSLKTTRLVTGKIDRRLVAQLGYDNANVFHRIVTDRYKNYFIHISIDASGSMEGTKLYQAVVSAVAIAQAASMTTGIRVQISLRGTENIGSRTEKCVTLYAYDSAYDKMNKIKTYFKYLKTFGCTPEGIAFKSIEKDLKADAKGDELIFINYSDGEPTDVYGTHSQYNGVQFTRRVVNGFRDLGMNVISYFITGGYIGDSTKQNFQTMYGTDAKFINPEDMRDIAKTMNAKFLEMTH